MTTPTRTPVVEPDEHQQLLDRAQPIRLVSISDVTIGQLVGLYFKLVIASIPVAITVGVIVGIFYAMIYK